MSLSLTCATENASFFCSVPAVTPVVTTSWRRLMSLAKEKSNDCGPAFSVMGFASAL